jgi:NADH:ubiquinone oxidoreductase subunit 5 (subunit L)/multisubunit Na+/H+ antiporter MnhA subunit
MTWPLLVLAVPSVAVAWLPLGEFIGSAFGGHGHGFSHGAHGVDPLAVGVGPLFERLMTGLDNAVFGPFNHNTLAATLGLFAVLLGGSLAWTCYGKPGPDPLPKILGSWGRILRGRFYFDEIYSGIVVPIHDLMGIVADWVDRWLVNGLAIRGLHGTAELVGRTLRLVQSGNLQTYSFLFAAGLAVVAWFTLR